MVSTVVSKGLDEVVFGSTKIAWVGGETGELVYRGYDIADLAEHADYESVAHLLLYGHPPSSAEREKLANELRTRRDPPAAATRVVDALPPGLPPLDAMRTLLSALGDGSVPYPPTVEQGLELVARTPTLLARYVRRSAGRPPVAPRNDLDQATHNLYSLTGEVPDAAKARALAQYAILLADHGMNASTFALCVVLSTQSDLLSAATAALGALKGPLHGGAPSRVSEMLDAIGRPERAHAWIAERLAARQLLFGFGHRAYKVEDPRARILKGIAERIASPARMELALTVEREALAALRAARPNARLYTNVEYYSAVVLEAIGLPPELFTPTFAVARTAGWAAHALEQAADNRLIRPDSEYVGPRGLVWPAAGAS